MAKLCMVNVTLHMDKADASPWRADCLATILGVDAVRVGDEAFEPGVQAVLL